MALTYSTYVAQLMVMAQISSPTDPNFVTNLPAAINYAEDRIGRELNLLNTVASYSSLALTVGSRKLDFTAANLNVLQQVNVITPAATTNPELGLRNPVTIADKSYLDVVFGSPSETGLPANFALLDDHTLLFGPFPDAAYTVEIVGTFRQIPLSAANPTTWVSTYLPDLLLVASMIWMSGYQKNFGSQSDDPKMSQSWEAQYLSLRDSAGVEDARRKFQATGWTSDLPTAYNEKRT